MNIATSNLIAINGVRHSATILDRLWGLVQSRDKVDFRMDCCGQEIWAHRLVLGVFFEPERLLNLGPQHSQNSSLDLLIEFVYRGAVNVSEEQLDLLLELARQLDFTMLVDALLTSKKRIRVTKPPKPSPRVKIREIRSRDPNIILSANHPTSIPPGALILTNSTQVAADPIRTNWIPVQPKLEPDSDDETSANKNHPQTIRFRQNINQSITPEVDAETDYNVHLSSVSVTIEEEACSEIKLENFKSSRDVADDEPGASHEHDPLEPNYTDHFRCKSSGDECETPPSPGGGGAYPDDDDELDLEPDALSGDVATLMPLVDSEDLKATLKRFKRDFCETPRSSYKRQYKKHKIPKPQSEKVVRRRSNKPVVGEDGAPLVAAKPFCTVCQKEFDRPSQLIVHSRVHTGERPFKCQVCPMAFIHSGDLTKHARVHTGEKPYKCNLCKKEYSSGSNLTDHMRLHTGEKPYKCGVCDMAFVRSGVLRSHERIHTGEKPYKCEVCQMEYKRLENLKRHIRSHTGEKPYKCELCPKEYKRLQNLKSHRKLHTGEKSLTMPHVADVEDCNTE